MKRVTFTLEALDELADAAAWYRRQRRGLDAQFLDEVDQALPGVSDAPAAYSRLLDLPTDLEIRRALLPRFPYALVFIELPTEVRVLAVAHVKRRPGYWLSRVSS